MSCQLLLYNEANQPHVYPYPLPLGPPSRPPPPISPCPDFFIIFYFFYFWLRWVFIAARGLSLVAESGATLRCCARALGHTGFSSCGSRALELRLSTCGTRPQLLCGMWDPPRPRIQPMSPKLAGGFLTTSPPGSPPVDFFKLVV